MKTQITKEQLNLFVLCGKHYITDQMDKKSELWEAVNSILPIALKKLQKVDRQKELARINLCKKTSTKHLDMDKNGRYQFTEDDNIKLYERFDDIDNEMVDIPTQVIEKYPTEGLTFDTMRGFEGIVIPVQERIKFEEEEDNG